MKMVNRVNRLLNMLNNKPGGAKVPPSFLFSNLMLELS